MATAGTDSIEFKQLVLKEDSGNVSEFDEKAIFLSRRRSLLKGNYSI